jgi:hypothetical protein
VPVAYTWPAGSSGGPLKGYNYDRESSTFTVFHLKQFWRRALVLRRSIPDIQFIVVRVAGFAYGRHYYFCSDPAVSSDLLLLLRDNRRPGAENGRPLAREVGGLWRIDPDYPAPVRGTHR